MTSQDRMYVPTDEAVAYFRAALQRDIDWMKEQRQDDEGWQKACRMIEYRTLGDESGCVITAFDRRGPRLWRAMYGEEADSLVAECSGPDTLCGVHGAKHRADFSLGADDE